MFPPLTLLQLRFRTLKPIRKLPHFHGCHWSALLRNLLKFYLPDVKLADSGIRLQSVETGISTYEAGEPVHLGLSVTPKYLPEITRLLNDFNRLRVANGHFQPGVTIELVGVDCRISKKAWDASSPSQLTEQLLSSEIDKLCQCDQFTLQFISPAWLTRPKGQKSKGHQYCDEDYFCAKIDRGYNPLEALFLHQRHGLEANAQGLRIRDSHLQWITVCYGEGKNKKTYRGIVGEISVIGASTRHQAEVLVLGQFFGVGKNPAFGFGYYRISELSTNSDIASLSRGHSILHRCLDLSALELALKQLPNSSPGPDGLTVADYRFAGLKGLKPLSERALKVEGFCAPVKTYRPPKVNGRARNLFIQNVGERIVHRSLSSFLGLSIDPLLSESSYAYRRGLNRKNAARKVSQLLSQGYSFGIKADIKAFFDSVSINRLLSLLNGLYPQEPAIGLISDWLAQAESAGATGLPQGGSLSPVLSNLFLDRFDRNMATESLRLVRFADDFVLLSNVSNKEQYVLEKIQSSLHRLGLRLNQEKTIRIHRGKPIHFLGYLVSADSIEPDHREQPAMDQAEEWTPLFKDDWQVGQPVYLSTLCRGARSRGAHLVVSDDQQRQEKIPWNGISRIVVVGRSPLSGGVIYRSVKENIPITFIDIIGKTRGHLQSARYSSVDLSRLQDTAFSDDQIILQLSREIVAAKISNSQAILRRNDASRPELNQLASRAKNAHSLEQLRGFEGAAAKSYFAAFSTLVEPFTFTGRIYRPPDGPVNAMLSFGYTLLYHRIVSALREKGFNPRKGFFHQGRGAHCALASDLQEELRHLVERIVLALIHLREIAPKDFVPHTVHGTRTVRLSGEAFRAFVRRFERTMAAKFNYGQRGQISYNGYLDEMADALRRTLKLQIPYTALRIR